MIAGRGIFGPTLREAVESHLGAKAYVIHRLDRDASGIVLFAKDPVAHRALSLAFETRKVHKFYLALVEGQVAEDATIDRPIRAFGSGRMGMAPEGKLSRTRYRVRERLAGATLLEVEPETGRRHQIRVHLYSIGHPVLGDSLYGKQRPVGGASRLMLHALGLKFEFEGHQIELRCETPVDFVELLNKWRATS